MTKEVLVVGGGPAGVTATRALTDLGAKVVLVERTDSLGGRARDWTCKGLAECRNCGVCFVIDRANEVLREADAEVLLLAEISSVQRAQDGYEVKIKTMPRYVTDDCIGCGKCVDVCPVEGKAIFPPTGSGQPRVYWIDKKKCLHFKKGKCDKCSQACPTEAVNYEDRARSITRKVSDIIFATGISPVEACEVGRLGCGIYKDVISSVDAERMLNEAGKLVRPSDGTTPKRIAVMQCVGSRSVKVGVEYCSKFCCKYATKISQLLLDINPETNLDFYFMDLRTLYEPQDEFKTWAKGKKTVRLIRSMPASIFQRDDGKLIVRVASETDMDIQELEYDMVILSVGMRPEGVKSDLAKSLGIQSDEMGFAAVPTEAGGSHVHIAGAVGKPMDIEEAAVGATAIAARIASPKEESR